MKNKRRVLLLSNDQKTEQFLQKNIPSFNPERYSAFIETFREKNFGILEVGELKKEMGGGKAQTFWIDKNLEPHKDISKGIESSLIIASGFNGPEGFPGKEEVSSIMDYIEKQVEKGVVGNYINSKRSTLFEDKASILSLQKQGFKVPYSKPISGFSDLEESVHPNKNYVLKPRFGSEGKGIINFNSQNINELKNKDLTNYLMQEEICIESESRLIFFDYEFLGARIIHDRNRPWENESSSSRSHLIRSYDPPSKEIEEARKILKHTDTIWGGVDFAHNKEGNFKYLEMNGVGVGLGFSGGPYNLNKDVAEKVKNKYLK